jgi:formamidopyrimidine-DNA glycosylase
MPELPEVETTRKGISPHLIGKTIVEICIRQPKLRFPVPTRLNECHGQRILAVNRRAKYLYINLPHATILIHLGMSGHLQVLKESTPANKHDHIDVTLSSGMILRYTDPRRFGLWDYYHGCIQDHPLISHLGPEPLESHFTTEYLYQQCQTKSSAIKNVLMNNKVVVGVGNIYACESLFYAGVHPLTPAKMVSHSQCEQLHTTIQETLQRAIANGGTTLKDFMAADGKPGYFQQQLSVYGRSGSPCIRCKTTIESRIIGGRNSFYCPSCQTMPGGMRSKNTLLA